LTVCEWNNLIPGETMFIDDSKQHVDGAAAAGLVAVHLTPEMKLEELFR
jgi:FMN phosphatase YigB (HAD superfamily)